MAAKQRADTRASREQKAEVKTPVLWAGFTLLRQVLCQPTPLFDTLIGGEEELPHYVKADFGKSAAELPD